MSHSEIEKLAYSLWEQQGKPDGLHTDHWAEAERRISMQTGTPSDSKNTEAKTSHDNHTPAKATSSSSRQQTVPNQDAQTGSPQLDRALSK
jgi:hypothetical protein